MTGGTHGTGFPELVLRFPRKQLYLRLVLLERTCDVSRETAQECPGAVRGAPGRGAGACPRAGPVPVSREELESEPLVKLNSFSLRSYFCFVLLLTFPFFFFF